MSYSAGVFSINSVGQPVVSGTTILASVFNAFTADVATGLSTCMLKDGTQTQTANIGMAGFKFTNLGAGTTAGDSVRYEQALLLAVGGTVSGAVTMSANLNVPDTNMRILGSSDATKIVRFEVDGLTTATTRVATMVDRNAYIGLNSVSLWQQNLNLAVSFNAGAATIAIKTLAGADPSAGDPVMLTIGATTFPITTASSITIPSTATMGVTANTNFRVWVLAINDSGTIRLGVVQTVTSTSVNSYSRVNQIFNLRSESSPNITTIGTGSDFGCVIYSNATSGGGAFVPLGYMYGGLVTPGTWLNLNIRTYQAGTPLPGDVISELITVTGAVSTGSTVTVLDDTIPDPATEGFSVMSATFTPTDRSNAVQIEAIGNYATTAAATLVQFFVINATTTVAVGASRFANTGVLGQVITKATFAGQSSATTWDVYIAPTAAATVTFNGVGGARLFGGAFSSTLVVKEIMT